jgi:ribulose-phosphate 3-epimerase
VSWSEWVRGAEIEPSLYAADFLRLGEQLERLLEAGARVFHFDVGDGHFVPPVTIGPVVLRSIVPLVHERGGVLDCHLMVDDPVHHFGEIAESGGDSVTFHVEVADDADAVIAAARELGLGAGVACNPGTPVEWLAAAAEAADLALCMSIEPGYSGQAFMPDALGRLERLRALLPDRVHVQVDGGIGRENVAAARAAGANLLVAGTAVFRADDVGAAYRELAAAVSS